MNAVFWSLDNKFSDNLTEAVVVCNGPSKQSIMCWVGIMVPYLSLLNYWQVIGPVREDSHHLSFQPGSNAASSLYLGRKNTQSGVLSHSL